MSSCATAALLAAPVLVTLGVALPTPAHAQTVSLPSSPMGVVLNNYGGATDFVVGTGTTISGPQDAVLGNNSHIWTLTNSGMLTGSAGAGVSFAAGGSLTNSGTGSHIAGYSGVSISGGLGTVSNDGTIIGTGYYPQAAVVLADGGNLTNTGTASLISGTNGSGVAVGGAGGGLPLLSGPVSV